VLDGVKEDLYQLALDAQSGKLAAYGKIAKGDFPPLTQDSKAAALTIDWDGNLQVNATGNHYELTGRFALSSYASAARQPDADTLLERALLHYNGSAWTGLYAFLGPLGSYTDDYGHTYKLAIQPETQRGTVSKEASQVCTVAAVVYVDVTTWLPRTAF